MDENRVVHCKAKKQKDFQIPKQSFVDQSPRHKMTSIGIYKAGAGRLSLPYMFFEEAMITVHRHQDYMELDMIKCEERKCLPYLEELSDFGILHDFYGKSLQNIVGACYYYRVVGKTIPIPKQFANRDIEVFISDHASHKVYLIPVTHICFRRNKGTGKGQRRGRLYSAVPATDHGIFQKDHGKIRTDKEDERRDRRETKRI